MPLSSWLDQASKAFDSEHRQRLNEALRLHQRYRFDPAGLGDSERRRLRELCHAVAAES